MTVEQSSGAEATSEATAEAAVDLTGKEGRRYVVTRRIEKRTT